MWARHNLPLAHILFDGIFLQPQTNTMRSLLRSIPGLRKLPNYLTREFPWRETAMMLRQRFREDRLAQSASSLTLTTLTALVPLFAVMLAIFTAFPAFARLQQTLQDWMVSNLIPAEIANQVVASVSTFVRQASQLGAISMVFFIVTAVMLMSSITTQFNAIWRVRKPRPLGQRMLLFWALISVGPIALAGSIAASSYLVSLSQGWIGSTPMGTPALMRLLIELARFAFMTAGMTALYYFIPHAKVRLSHATAGGLFAAAGLSLGQRLLGLYLLKVPSYSLIYGTFATLPLLLLWVYIAWIIVLLGAVIAAYLPSIMEGLHRPQRGRPTQFALMIELLSHLHNAQQQPQQQGLSLGELARLTRTDTPHLEPLLQELANLGWVARLDEKNARWVLLVSAEQTSMRPLLEQRLFPYSPALHMLWQQPLESLNLACVLHTTENLATQAQPAPAAPVLHRPDAPATSAKA